MAGSGGKQRVVLDGQAGPEYDAIGQGRVTFGADGKHVGYEAEGADGIARWWMGRRGRNATWQ